MPPRLIENRHLRRRDVPQVDVASLRPEGWDGSAGYSAADWARLWEFALTFDGYRYLGGDPGAAARLASFAESVRESYFGHGRLPELDLALLRACLFAEQRRWCKHAMEPPEERDKQYLNELVAAIRLGIS